MSSSRGHEVTGFVYHPKKISGDRHIPVQGAENPASSSTIKPINSENCPAQRWILPAL
jgi:hypothetical protein